ncbi:restriction endonuclease subunit S [Raoultibacter phocaeensis]|uniref:restriction endonuclease subunit S n=1 Tax=Raoultibacter phocaeensis TaxID=2479841 RepID=UPI00111B06C1|nr:restriction endonuclease subunit S [Raoultibacter phocaeensis]
MSESKRNAPKLRFPGFTDPWEQRKLGDAITVWSGRDYKHLGEGSVPVYGTGGYMLGVDAALSENEDAIGIGRKGTIDKPYLLEAPFWTVDTLFYCIPKKNYDLQFSFQLFSRIDWKRKDESTGVPSLSKATINNVKIRVPDSSEQTQIGAFFRSLDGLITLHQRKVEHLKLQKRGFLQKMFPKDGADRPEIRFPGFTDAWEQRKLGESGTAYSGLSGKSKEDFGHGEARFVPYTNVFDNPVTDTTRLEAVEIDATQNEVKRGDALFTVSSETPEEVGMSSVWLSDQRNVYLNSFCFGYRQSGTFDSGYLAYMLRSPAVRSDLTLLAQGISRFNISKNKVMELEVSYPFIDEQRQIGAFFRSLDGLITLHQRKLEHLQKLKKGLLQQMFI